jgi:hypothetical protein
LICRTLEPEITLLGFLFMAMKQGDLPFSPRNRPWLTPDCIVAMNEQWMACMTNLPEEYQDDLKEWAAVKVEMGRCKDDPQSWEACEKWGDEWAKLHHARPKPKP